MPDDLLLPYQKRWLEETVQFAVHEKSRRIGVSWAQAGDEALYVSTRNTGNCWYMGQDKDMAQGFIQDAGWWSKEIYALACSEIEEDVFWDEENPDKDIFRFSIHYNSGFRITALSSRPANMRSKGRPGEHFVFDEAAFHMDFPALLKAAMAVMMWGCRVRVISTHDGEDNPFNELITDIRAGKRPGKVHHTDFMTAVGQGLYKRICQMTGRVWTQSAEDNWVAEMYAFYGDDAAEELDVVPSQGSGTVLARAVIERCMKPANLETYAWAA